jgi:site-specific DNA-methyltransferase (adenine-specific)
MSQLTPYYDHAGITIYHGDCRDILPQLEPVEIIVTDPPYPDLKGGLSVTFTSGVGDLHFDTKTVGTPWGNNIEGVQLSFDRSIFGGFVFCSFHSVDHMADFCGDKVALITWYQRNAMPSMNNSPHYQTEFIWAIKKQPGLVWKNIKTHYDIPRLQAGCMAKERICNDGIALHPAQKPLSLIRSLLSVGGTGVLDPYMGTGTTLVAAKQLGRKAIGIEIEEKYCEIAVKRLQQEVLPL